MNRRWVRAALTAAGVASLVAAAGTTAGAGTYAPGNPTPVIINSPQAGASSQVVAPYPSSVTTWGLDGPITDVNVDLDNVTFAHSGDIEVLLVSPQGTSVVLFSGACASSQTIRAYWTFDDEAAQKMPTSGACGSGRWKPTSDYAEAFSPPAPPRGSSFPFYGRTLSAFRGENPNGTWRLFVRDRNPRFGTADHGVILNGFRVLVTTQSRPVVVPADIDGGGPASTYPMVKNVAGQNGRIAETFVYLDQLSHTYPDDLDVLLVAPNGQKVLLMSDACGGTDLPNGRVWRFNDTDTPLPDEASCAPGAGVNFAPTDREPGESLPAPAPPGPYSTSLSSLNGLSPNGDWRLFVSDDRTGDSGYLQGFSLSFDLGSPPQPNVAPNTVLSAGPSGPTESRRARFAFTSTEIPATFECRLDAGAWRSCRSGVAYRRLAPGRHVFLVRASDLAGARDATPARRAWRIRR